MDAGKATITESDAAIRKRLRGILKRRVIMIAEAVEGFGAPTNDVEAERALKTVALLEKVIAQVFNDDDLAEAEDDLGDNDDMYKRQPVGDGPDAVEAWARILERKLAGYRAVVRGPEQVPARPDGGRTADHVQSVGVLGTGRSEDT